MGEVSHENKTGSGMPPDKQLKNLKKKTGFDLAKKRASYVKKNKKSIDEDGRTYLPDGTVIQFGRGYIVLWKHNIIQSTLQNKFFLFLYVHGWLLNP